jgi:pimeloyl-ACP methyl ester carboxylesterase
MLARDSGTFRSAGIANVVGMSTHIVLVPGYWLGGWAWDNVATLLEEQGNAVTAVTLPGLESAGTDRRGIGLGDHAAAVIAALEARPADRTVLVAHSGGGVPATVALDRRPDLVDHVVYVDSGPAADGFAVLPDHDGDEVPLPSWEELAEMGNSLAGLGEEELSRFRDRAVPHPGGVAREPATLDNPARFAVPGTIVCCSLSSADVGAMADQGVPFLLAVRDYDLDLVDLPTGHWPMWSRPDDLAGLLHEVATRAGVRA